MCLKLKFDKKDKTKYWLFNKEVTKEEWHKRYELGIDEREKKCSKCGK